MSSSKIMATYQTLKQLSNEGFSPLKGRYRSHDNSIEAAICAYRQRGSTHQIHYAIKCSKDKLHIVGALERAKIPVIANFPNLTGHYLQYKGELTYEKVVEVYSGDPVKNSPGNPTGGVRKNTYGIYHLLKETHRLCGDEAVDELRERFLEDGIPDKDLLYYNLPVEVKAVLFQKDREAALAGVLAFHKENHPKIDFIVYDFVRNSPDAISVTRKLLSHGIPKTLIGSTALVSVVAGKMSVQELRVLYDFESPHFAEIMDYMLNNPVLFGHKTAISLAEKMVYHGIDKTTILRGPR